MDQKIITGSFKEATREANELIGRGWLVKEWLAQPVSSSVSSYTTGHIELKGDIIILLERT